MNFSTVNWTGAVQSFAPGSYEEKNSVVIANNVSFSSWPYSFSHRACAP